MHLGEGFEFVEFEIQSQNTVMNSVEIAWYYGTGEHTSFEILIKPKSLTDKLQNSEINYLKINC